MNTEKLHMMKLILETNNPKILESIKNLFSKERKVDIWNSRTNDKKHEIEFGFTEVENGETVDYETMIRKHRR
jgi:hypothetical protein